MATWGTYHFPEESGLEEDMFVVVTPPPYEHPRWSRRLDLYEEGRVWCADKMVNPVTVRISHPTGIGRLRRRQKLVSWRWLRPASPLEMLAGNEDVG